MDLKPTAPLIPDINMYFATNDTMQCQVCRQQTHSLAQIQCMLPTLPDALVRELHEYQFTVQYYCVGSDCFAFICELVLLSPSAAVAGICCARSMP